MQSLVRKGDVKELVKDYGMVLVDECLEVINSIYNNDNFLTVFSNDILLAKNEVVIVSPTSILFSSSFFSIIYR